MTETLRLIIRGRCAALPQWIRRPDCGVLGAASDRPTPGHSNTNGGPGIGFGEYGRPATERLEQAGVRAEYGIYLFAQWLKLDARLLERRTGLGGMAVVADASLVPYPCSDGEMYWVGAASTHFWVDRSEGHLRQTNTAV